MTHIAVCDDSALEQTQLYQMVSRYYADKEQACIIDCFVGGNDLLKAVRGGKTYDIVLLDIIMGDIDGIETARRLREMNENAYVVFITSSPDYALDSYSVYAFNYLLKPVQEGILYKILSELEARLSAGDTAFIAVKTKSGTHKVPYKTLLFVESDAPQLKINKVGGEVLHTYGKIDELAAILLEDKRFIRSHQSFLVNLDFVETFATKGFVLSGGIFLPMSRSYSEEAKRRYFSYLFGAKET